MKIDAATLNKIAHLARLEIDESKRQELTNSLSDILDWVEKLNELDTSEVEPLTHMSYEVNAFRADEPAEPLPRDKGLSNAPKHDSTYFKVPKVLE